MSKLNLEEAAKKYVASIIYKHGLYDGDFLMPVCEDIFKAGAEWREEQHKSVPGKYAEMDFESARNTFSEDVYNHNRKNKTPIDMVDLDDAFETGADWMEKQMMSEAVEGEVHKYDKFSYVKEKNSKSLTELLAKFNNGDKVRIIIVKENEE